MSLRAFIQHNFWLKLFSLLLATLIWFAINFGIESGLRPAQNPITNRTTREIYRVPVRVLAPAGDQRVFKIEPRDVDVTLTGESAVIREVMPKNIAAFVDLSNVRSSRETNQQVRLDVPAGVTVVEILPRAVNIEEVVPGKP